MKISLFKKNKNIKLIGFLLVLGFFLYYITSQSTKNYNMCKQKYALCTSARCFPNPNNYNETICSCDIENGHSISTVPCDQLKPYKKDGVDYIFSTFSPIQGKQGKKVLTCGKEYPWSDCLNKKCEIDPLNPNKAVCACQLVKGNQDWTTYGGNSNPKNCVNNYLSGSIASNHSVIIDFWNKNK